MSSPRLLRLRGAVGVGVGRTQLLEGIPGVIPAQYRTLVRDPRTRCLLAGLGVSALGDGMSAVTIAWLAVLIAPRANAGVYVGVVLSAYTLPGVAGALVFGRFLRHRPARVLVLAHTCLRTCFLGTVAILWVAGSLGPDAYVALIAGSSLLAAWGNAGEHTMLSQLAGAEGRLSANSLFSAQVSVAVIAGPSLAGLLVVPLGIGSLIALDAASFAFLGIQAWRTGRNITVPAESAPARATESGFRQLRRLGLISLITLTWVFFFLYGPVEDAVPLYVTHDLNAGAGMLGAYWTSFGIGALAASLITGTLRSRNIRRATLLIVAGWGACLLPFAFSPAGVTLACFALGGFIYGPFVPMTYALFQSATDNASLPAVLAACSAIIMTASPLGTAAGGPIVGALGAAPTLTASGAATVLLAGTLSVAWGPGRKALIHPVATAAMTGAPQDRTGYGQSARRIWFSPPSV